MAKRKGLRTVVLAVAAVVPAGVAVGQMTGTSHPDEIPVTTTPEGISQPVVYETPASTLVKTPAMSVAPPPVVPRSQLPEPAVIRASVAQPVMADERGDRAVSEGSVRASDTPREMRARDHGDDPDAGIVTRVPGAANALPAGAMLHIRLRQGLTTASTRPGTVFTAALIDPVERDGRVLLPAGATVEGRVTEVHAGKHGSSAASIHLEPASVTLPDGTHYALHAQVIDSSLYRTTSVDEEGTISHKGAGKGTVAAVGLATGAGAASGAVFGGWPGALVGGVIGAGVSTVVWLRQDRQADLPAGREVGLGLRGALTVGN